MEIEKLKTELQKKGKPILELNSFNELISDLISLDYNMKRWYWYIHFKGNAYIKGAYESHIGYDSSDCFGAALDYNRAKIILEIPLVKTIVITRNGLVKFHYRNQSHRSPSDAQVAVKLMAFATLHSTKKKKVSKWR